MQRLIALLLVIISTALLFFQIGRAYERTHGETIKTCQAKKHDAQVALEGCEEANHLALIDTAEAEEKARICDEFFNNINNLGELLAP